MSGDRVFRDLNYEDALAALQKAQVDLAVEQGKLRKTRRRGIRRPE